MGDQDVDHGVEAGRGEAGGGEAGGGGAAFTYLDPIQVLKRAPSSLAWKFFQFRKYETKVDETPRSTLGSENSNLSTTKP